MRESIEQQLGQLDEQAVQLYEQGGHEQAVGLAAQSRDLACGHLGEAHPAFATSLNTLAGLYRAMSNYAAAPLYRQALEI